MKDNIQEKRLILEDTPIEEEGMDKFGHSIFVEVLFNLIKEIEKPCNVGLFGKWGVGKTSIVKILSSRLKNEEKIECIYIDAWKYSDESLKTQVLIEIDEKLNHPIGKEEIIDILYNVKEEEVIEKSSAKDFFAKTKFFWIFLGSMTIFDLFIHSLLGSAGIAGILALTLLLPFLVQLMIVIQSASVSMSRKRILPKKEWPGEFENIFRQMINKASFKKIVIVIDNLDRCQSATVIRMLTLLKTFMDIPKCIYVIPCDEEALLSHINTLDQEMGYFKKTGQEFLKKIFQVTIRIPPFLGENLEEYARNLRTTMRFSFDDNVQDVLVSAYAKNPRQIIHAFNKLTTLYLLAREKEKKGIIGKGMITKNVPFLAKISIVRDEWKDFYDELSFNAFLLEDVEKHFKGIDQAEVKKFFQENPGLEEFLNATRTVRADYIEPFLLLGQETYESAIPELERLRFYLQVNDVDRVYDMIERLSEKEKIQHTREILKITKRAIRGRRSGLGFNCLNVISRIYELLPPDFRQKTAEEFGPLLDNRVVIEYTSSLDPKKLFEILKYTHKGNKEHILTVLADAIFLENQLNIALAAEFIEHSETIGHEEMERLNEVIIAVLDSETPNAAKDIILSISKDETASKNLLGQRLLRKVIEKIKMEKGKQEGIDLYLQIKNHADQKTKEIFVSKELGFLDEPSSDRAQNLRQVLRFLLQLEVNDIPQSSEDELFSKIKREIKQLPIDQRTEFFQLVMKNFGVFSEKNRRDFINSDIREAVASGNPGTVDYISKTANKFGIDFLSDEKILNSLLSRIPNLFFQRGILEYLMRYAPEERQAEVKEKLIDILRGGDQNKILEALKAIESQFEYLEEGISDEISAICIDRAKRLTDRNQINAFLAPMLKHFSRLSNDRRDSIINCIIQFLKTPGMGGMGKSHYLAIKELLSRKEKLKLVFELTKGLQSISDEKLNGETKDLIDILLDLQILMKRNEMEELVKHILSMMKDTLSPEQNRAGLNYLSRFKNYRKISSSVFDQVFDQVSRAARPEEEQTSDLAKNMMKKLEKTKKKPRS